MVVSRSRLVGTLTHEIIEHVLKGRSSFEHLSESEVEAGANAVLAESAGVDTGVWNEVFGLLRRWRLSSNENLRDSTILAVEGPFEIGLTAEATLFGVYDLVIRSRKWGLTVVEWKTGKRRAGHDDQVALYAIASSVQYGKENEPICALVFELDAGNLKQETFSDVRMRLEAGRLARRVAAVEKSLSMRPVPVRPGWLCAGCPKRTICEPGRRFLAQTRA